MLRKSSTNSEKSRLKGVPNPGSHRHALLLLEFQRPVEFWKLPTARACALRSFSSVWLETLRTIAHQPPLSMGYARQEYWRGLPCPPPGDLPKPGTEPESLTSSALAGGLFATCSTWEARKRQEFLQQWRSTLLWFQLPLKSAWFMFQVLACFLFCFVWGCVCFCSFWVGSTWLKVLILYPKIYSDNKHLYHLV